MRFLTYYLYCSNKFPEFLFAVPKVPTTATAVVAAAPEEEERRSSRRVQRSATTEGVTSDDDASITDENTNKSLLNGTGIKPSKSRIDRWKAKHEAMLKLAESGATEAKEIGKVEDEDEDEDDEGKSIRNSVDTDKEEKPSSPTSTDDVEFPNLEPNGVCINLGDATPSSAGPGGADKKATGAAATNKPHTRQVQQALSV